jgi:hypothetical protein
MNVEFLQDIRMVGVLWIVVVGYIVSGTACSCLVREDKFDTKKFINGIIKSIVACGSLIIVAYIFTVMDLTALGFNADTIINAGSMVYTAKILRNAMFLLGITKDGKEAKNEGSILSGISDIEGAENFEVEPQESEKDDTEEDFLEDEVDEEEDQEKEESSDELEEDNEIQEDPYTDHDTSNANIGFNKSGIVAVG